MKAKEQNLIMQAAYDLIDFCGGELTMADVKKFWQVRSDEYNVDNHIKNLILQTALTTLTFK